MTDANSERCSQPDVLGHNTKGNSFYSDTAILIGLNPAVFPDSDYSVWSPTSPLDFRVFSNLGNIIRTARSVIHDGRQKSWNSSKVGLGIIDSLEDCSKISGKVLRPSESKNIIFSSSVRTKTTICQNPRGSSEAAEYSAKKIQGKNSFHAGDSNVLFEIGETHMESESFGKVTDPGISRLSPVCSSLDTEDFGFKGVTDHERSPSPLIEGSPNSNNFQSAKLNSNFGCTGSLPASENELSGDCTCVVTRCPVRVHGDSISGYNPNNIVTNAGERKHREIGGLGSGTGALFAIADFLSFCHHCNKKLEEGKDIYMYRGEKAFCSPSCRALEIMIDGEFEEEDPSSENIENPDKEGNHFGTGIRAAT